MILEHICGRNRNPRVNKFPAASNENPASTGTNLAEIIV
jgi:hypothetical protein